eukprot:6072218-Amphidinium_carterae.1
MAACCSMLQTGPASLPHEEKLLCLSHSGFVACVNGTSSWSCDCPEIVGSHNGCHPCGSGCVAAMRL